MANQPTKYRKFVVGAASAALVASAVAPVASAKDFSDTKGNTHEAAIDALSDAGIITGYEDGTFKPNKTLTRSDVVKMMGKWLVSEGYEVPEDYKTNMRFSDLQASTNDELLKYAAVVKDNGVFNGSNGRLLAGDNMSRENMAVVLVRAFDTVKDINLVEYVEAQDFDKEVTDLNSAKSEARTAINVLDFFDITTVAQFNPKDTTTRGHFATFLNNFLKADLSKVTGVVAGVESISAINTTTVEVKFVEGVTDINSLKFAIEGLEVKNAVLKQTDAKTVVLTTATQEGGKKYEITLNGNKLGSFEGISAVVPEKVTLETTSLQGILGKEVTVKANINVKEAGVPVTFNIVSESNKSLNADQVVEAFTDENGIAEYSYTRYAATDDNVQVYATGKANVRAFGKVYWANYTRLAVSEVTEGNALANGSKKVYKISSPENAGGYVNVAFKENVQATPDKLVTGAKLTDAQVFVLSPDGTTTVAANKYPYEVTTGGVQIALVKLNANGEATFTVEGSNATVTPVVFVDGEFNSVTNKWTGNGKLDATELQATAPSVKFELSHTLGLDVKAEGVMNAAAETAKGQGGREYTVTVSDKNGKLAPAGTSAYVTFPAGSISTDKKVYIVFADGSKSQVFADTPYEIKVAGTKGQATFKLVGEKDAFATPTVFLDNGTVNSKLDANDLQTVGEITYFVNAVVNNSDLMTIDANGDYTESAVVGDVVTYVYQSVDQNGFPYYEGTGRYEVTFQVTAQFGDVTVGNTTAGTVTVPRGTTRSVKANAVNGVATITTSSATPSTVTVDASASQVSLPNQSASVQFTAAPATTIFAGEVIALNDLSNVKVLYLKDAAGVVKNFKYAGGEFFDNTTSVGINTPLTETDFLAKLTSGAEVTYKKVGDKNHFYVTKAGSGAALPTSPAPTTVSVPATVTTAYLPAVTESFAKISSSIIDDVNFSDFTLTIADGSNTANVNVDATDTATDLETKINNALTTATIDALATVDSDGRVVITGGQNVNLTTSGAPADVLPSVTRNYVAAAPARAAEFVYNFTTSTVADISPTEKVTVNGITYTAGTSTVGKTFDATGNLATDLANLALVISVNDDSVSAIASTVSLEEILTLTERTGKEGTASTAAIKID
ncbi:hypothetical protein SLU01_01030 [Sporosarcina luteola]|uniref:SLH domain-containing protein n=1 Tax=Sporosarcina luteola TaxID=582850 RepID=A0A511Z2X1_9BACL|nr:S-layer homology domain-containing protein [Sporosarcina luteola]GEN81791.1 hypothetical protein SLU01_01030 [Sporosarcina luteola]